MTFRRQISTISSNFFKKSFFTQVSQRTLKEFQIHSPWQHLLTPLFSPTNFLHVPFLLISSRKDPKPARPGAFISPPPHPSPSAPCYLQVNLASFSPKETAMSWREKAVKNEGCFFGGLGVGGRGRLVNMLTLIYFFLILLRNNQQTSSIRHMG